MDNSFKKMGVSPEILKAIEEMGFVMPTEIQSQGIPHILNHEDLIVISKTGSGKTAVFGVPMLQMTDPLAEGPQGLILAPTRELAVQVDSDINLMSKYLPVKTTAVYGQHNINVEIQAINQGVTIISGTPGRVYDHIRHGKLTTKHIRFLVLDEADRMLDMGFFDQVVKIIKTLPKDRVTLLLSATMPTEVRKICREYMRQPVTIEIESLTKTVDTTKQVYCRVERSKKTIELHRILMTQLPESCMIFCNTKVAVDRVQSILARKGHSCQALHGDIPQSKRMKTIQQFKNGEFRLLIATDVAARGIHIDELSLVINYDVPVDKDSYVHRIGRTGRVGEIGSAITMVSEDDLMSLYEIEEHIGAMITEVDLPTDSDLLAVKDKADQWMQENLEKNRLVPSESVVQKIEHSRFGSQRSDHGRSDHGRPDHNRADHGRPAARKPEQRTDQTRPLSGTDPAKVTAAGNDMAGAAAQSPHQQAASTLAADQTAPAKRKRSRRRKKPNDRPAENIVNGDRANAGNEAGRSQKAGSAETRPPASVQETPKSFIGRLLQKISGK